MCLYYQHLKLIIQIICIMIIIIVKTNNWMGQLLIEILTVTQLVTNILILCAAIVTAAYRTCYCSLLWAIFNQSIPLTLYLKSILLLLCSLDQILSRNAYKGQVVSLIITLWRPHAVSTHSATDCRRPDHSKYSPSPLDPLRSQSNVPLCTLCAGCTGVLNTAVCGYRQWTVSSSL